jgi:hypothetical protein
MSSQASATFELKSWQEKPVQELDGGGKLTRASIVKAYQGDLEGSATLEYVMFYRADGTADFVGLEHVVGRIAGKSGSFVLRHIGTFEGGKATVSCSVVPGSGTGDLQGFCGNAGFAVGHQDRYPITLDYHFES